MSDPLSELRYSVIRTICKGLPGPSACVAPNCQCYEQNGGPVFDAIYPMFEAHFKEQAPGTLCNPMDLP